MANRRGNNGNSETLFFGTAAMKLKALVPWKKTYDQARQHIKIDIPLPTKVHIVKAMVFPIVMYGSESWTIKKAEH